MGIYIPKRKTQICSVIPLYAIYVFSSRFHARLNALLRTALDRSRYGLDDRRVQNTHSTCNYNIYYPINVIGSLYGPIELKSNLYKKRQNAPVIVACIGARFTTIVIVLQGDPNLKRGGAPCAIDLDQVKEILQNAIHDEETFEHRKELVYTLKL